MVDATGAVISSFPHVASTDGNRRIPSSVLAQAEYDHVEQVELLLSAGADPNARNNQGETALSRTYDDAVKQILIKHGAVPPAREEEKE